MSYGLCHTVKLCVKYELCVKLCIMSHVISIPYVMFNVVESLRSYLEIETCILLQGIAKLCPNLES